MRLMFDLDEARRSAPVLWSGCKSESTCVHIIINMASYFKFGSL